MAKELTAAKTLNKCERNKKNKMAYLRKKCVFIISEGMLFFYKFAHDIT